MAKDSEGPKRPRGRPRIHPVGEKRKRVIPPRGTKKLAPSKEGAELPRWWVPYMKELERNGGFKTLAKSTVGISKRTPEAYLERHPELQERFAEEQEQAIELATERILAEGVRRGVKGYKEPLVHQGRKTGEYLTRVSDTLLIFSANARGVGTRNPAQVNINFDAKALEDMPDDLLARLAAGENPGEIVAEWKARQAEKKV